MADKTEITKNGPEQGQQVERAIIAADGTVTVPCCEGELVSVDIADVDLLLGFSDGTYVVIPNGALDALSDTPHKVIFSDGDKDAFDKAHFSSDHESSLGDLFKLVGETNFADSGSIRVVSEKVNAQEDAQQDVVEELPPEQIDTPEVVAATAGKGPGADPFIPATQLLDPIDTDPVGPIIPPRPSVFKPGQKITSVEPTVRLDPSITTDDTINIAESDPTNMVTISGTAGGSAIVGDKVTVDVGGNSYNTTVDPGMTFSVTVPGNVLAPNPGLHTLDLPVSVKLVSSLDTSKVALDSVLYDVDTKAPSPAITLDASITDDNVVNIAESQGTVTVTGNVSELTGESDIKLAGSTVTLTINGTSHSGFVNAGGSFNIGVSGSAFAPTPNVEGSGTIDAQVRITDSHGNTAYASDTGHTFVIDTLAPTASINITSIAGDGEVNYSESLGQVAISGTVGGEVKAGDTVVVSLNGTDIGVSSVNADGVSFDVDVDGSVLTADPSNGTPTNPIAVRVETEDTAGNVTVAQNTGTYTQDATPPTPQIDLIDPITGDSWINGSEALDGSIAITGTASGVQVGDQVTVTVNGVDSIGFVGSDLTFSVNVDGNDLKQAVGGVDQAVGSIDVKVTTAASGGASIDSPVVQATYTLDETAPTASISVDSVGTLSYAEYQGDVEITGTVGGDAQNGGIVSLLINNKTYSVTADGSTFSITVSGNDLSNDFDKTINASVETVDTAGNSTTATATETYALDPSIPSPQISLDPITGDNIINQAEAAPASTLTITGSVSGDAQVGDQVAIFVNGTEVTSGYVNADNTFSINISATDLAPVVKDGTGTISATVTAAGTSETATDSQTYTVDISAPTPTIIINDIAGDNWVNIAESSLGVDVVVSGSVTGAHAGDLVTLTINGSDYEGLVRYDGTSFSINVPGADLAADSNKKIVATVTTYDAAGNVGEGDSTLVYEVDTTPPSATITVADNTTPLNIDDIAIGRDVNITFNEELKAGSFSLTDIQVEHGELTNFQTSDNMTWTATLIPEDTLEDTTNLISIDFANVTDTHDNPGSTTGISNNYEVDTIAPQVDPTLNVQVSDLIITDSDVDGVTSFTVTVDFSEAMDTNFVPSIIFNDVLDNSLNNDLVTDVSPVETLTFESGAWSNLDKTYTATYSVIDDGIDFDVIKIDVTDAYDAAGNLQQNYTSTTEFSIDTLNPSVQIDVQAIVDDGAGGSTYADVGDTVTYSERHLKYTLTFSEEVLDLPLDDINITKGSYVAGSLTKDLVADSDGKVWTFEVWADDKISDNLTVTVDDSLDPINSIADLNGNTLISSSHSVFVDTLNPRVDISNDNSDGTVSDDDIRVTYTLDFTDVIQGLEMSADETVLYGVDITGGTFVAGSLAQDLVADPLGTIWTFKVDATDQSTANLVVTANTNITDTSADLRPLISVTDTLAVDTENATVEITHDVAPLDSGRVVVNSVDTDGDDTTVQYTATFSEAVNGFDLSDLSITGGDYVADSLLQVDAQTWTFSVDVPLGSEDALVVTLATVDNGTPSDTSDDYIDVFDQNGNPVNVVYSGEHDVLNNPIVGPNILDVDTINPTLFSASENAFNPTIITDNTPAGKNVSFDIRFDETVFPFLDYPGTSYEPTFSFSEDLLALGVLKLDNTPILHNGDEIVYRFDVVANSNVDIDNIDVTLSGVYDAAGNPYAGSVTLTNVFSVDTLNPEVLSLTHDAGDEITVSDGSVLFNLNFTEAVQNFDANALSFSGGSYAGGLTPNADFTEWTFLVNPAAGSITPLQVTVNNSYDPGDGSTVFVTDENGNRLVGYDSELIPVDTQNTFPFIDATLYTSPELKVDVNDVSAGTPVGASDSSPDGQATREIIEGTGLNDTIDHNDSFNDPLSGGATKWVKVLHLDLTFYDTLSEVTLSLDPAVVSSISGFELQADGFVWDAGAGTLTASSQAVLDALGPVDVGTGRALDVKILYTVPDTGEPELDFSVQIHTVGDGSGEVDYSADKTLYFTWADADTNEADFDLTAVDGSQVMVLPRDGLGVDIYAGDGGDTVYAGAGNDTVYGDQYFDGSAGVEVVPGGNDTIYGGTGNDALYGGGADDYLSGDEGDDSLYGEDGVDELHGGVGSDYLDGGAGADTIYGEDGIDTLFGGAGIDYLYGGAGDDTLIGGADGDFFYGGDASADSGTDTVSYAGSAAVDVSLITGGVGGDATGDQFDGIENLIGSDNADILAGDTDANTLSGGGGDDTFYGSGGGDTYYGGISGSDSGTDTVSYIGAGAGVDASLIDGGTGGLATGDSYDGIENLIGSDYADILTGDSSDNVFTGGDGGDTLVGGAGSDTASYATAGPVDGVDEGVTAVLVSDFGDLQTGDAAGDQFDSIENLVGSDYNDVLYGDSGSNVLSGGLGDDKLYGLGGADELYGEAGDDTLHVNQGEDTVVSGGADTDTIELHGLTASYDLAPLAAKVDSVEILDIADGVDTEITITSQDILNMLDGGTDPLTIQADGGDSLVISLSGTETYNPNDPGPISPVDGTIYTISDGATTVAQVQWEIV